MSIKSPICSLQVIIPTPATPIQKAIIVQLDQKEKDKYKDKPILATLVSPSSLLLKSSPLFPLPSLDVLSAAAIEEIETNSNSSSTSPSPPLSYGKIVRARLKPFSPPRPFVSYKEFLLLNKKQEQIVLPTSTKIEVKFGIYSMRKVIRYFYFESKWWIVARDLSSFLKKSPEEYKNDLRQVSKTNLRIFTIPSDPYLLEKTIEMKCIVAEQAFHYLCLNGKRRSINSKVQTWFEQLTKKEKEEQEQEISN